MTQSIYESSLVYWTLSSQNESEKHYCADGDGVVQLVEKANGNFAIEDQFDIVELFNADTLNDALERAQNYLEVNYPAIFADCSFEG